MCLKKAYGNYVDAITDYLCDRGDGAYYNEVFDEFSDVLTEDDIMDALGLLMDDGIVVYDERTERFGIDMDKARKMRKSRISNRIGKYRYTGEGDDPYWDASQDRWKLGGDTHVKVYQVSPESQDMTDPRNQYFSRKWFGWDKVKDDFSMDYYNQIWEGDLSANHDLNNVYDMLQEHRPIETSQAIFSLSVGDLVEMDGRLFMVDTFGFTEISKSARKSRIKKKVDWNFNGKGRYITIDNKRYEVRNTRSTGAMDNDDGEYGISQTSTRFAKQFVDRMKAKGKAIQKDYNGYENYETWGFVLIWQNDYGMQSYTEEMANEAGSYQEFMNNIRGEVDYILDEVSQFIQQGNQFVQQLCLASVSEVDVDEVVESICGDYKDQWNDAYGASAKKSKIKKDVEDYDNFLNLATVLSNTKEDLEKSLEDLNHLINGRYTGTLIEGIPQGYDFEIKAVRTTLERSVLELLGKIIDDLQSSMHYEASTRKSKDSKPVLKSFKDNVDSVRKSNYAKIGKV